MSNKEVYLLNKRLIKKHDIYMCPKSKSTCPNDCEHKIPHEMIEEHLTNYCKDKLCMKTSKEIDECKLVTIYL